uniref:Uncharacterized protein n=1 Tax=Knipowitschia caucasica TaxID=637954 RepID=A0AAV2L293_KNICA
MVMSDGPSGHTPNTTMFDTYHFTRKTSTCSAYILCQVFGSNPPDLLSSQMSTSEGIISATSTLSPVSYGWCLPPAEMNGPGTRLQGPPNQSCTPSRTSFERGGRGDIQGGLQQCRFKGVFIMSRS